MQIFDTAMKAVKERGVAVKHLPRAVRTVDQKLRSRLAAAGEKADVRRLLNEAIGDVLLGYAVDSEERKELEQEFQAFQESLGDFRFAVTAPYWGQREKKLKGSGGLLSITVNPYACKGCMECVKVCNDDALRSIPQTTDTTSRLRKEWDFWMQLPTTSPEFIRIDSLDEKIGALETLLLDKKNYMGLVCGDGACLGCGEKTVVHLFVATVEALMQPRVKKQVQKLDGLIEQMDQHIRLKLASSMDLSNSTRVEQALDKLKDSDVTLASFSGQWTNGTAPRR